MNWSINQLIELLVAPFQPPKRLKIKKPTVFANRAFSNYKLLEMLVNTKSKFPTFAKYCEDTNLAPIPFWEDAQFAAESKVVKIVDEKTGLTMFEKGWGQ